MMRNILGAKCTNVLTKTKASAQAVASRGNFQNMSEKERYLKAMTEFNQLHSMIKGMVYEDYEFIQDYLTKKVGPKLFKGVPTREQTRNFIKFLNLGDKRSFSLKTSMQEIVLAILNINPDSRSNTAGMPPSARTHLTGASSSQKEFQMHSHRMQTADPSEAQGLYKLVQ